MKIPPLLHDLLGHLRYLILPTVLAIATPVSAQHIFLDLTGDGANTQDDVLSGSLPVNVDVYLRTDRNRDGSPASCVEQTQPLSIFSFEFILRASRGSVLWGSFNGALPGGATRTAQNATDLYVGYFPQTPVLFPPGTVHLGSLSVTPLSSSPVLSFAASTPLSAVYLTSFGSKCRGEDGDNTLKLGSNWFDADGTVGPLVANVSGRVFLDANASSPGTCAPEAGEPDLPGWIVALSPGGITALTSRLGHYELLNVPIGTYSVQLSPSLGWAQTCPPGGVAQVITVAPGQTYPDVNFGVRPVNSPPKLSPIPNITVPFGAVTDVPLTASDPDLTSLTFSLAGGPSFASVSTTGLGTGILRLAPQQGDVGTYTLAVSASDGAFISERKTAVQVLNATGVGITPPGRLAASITPNPLYPGATLTFRTSRPGFVRVTLYDVGGRRVRVLRDQPVAPAGDHRLWVESRDEAGKPLPSGVYFFKLETSEGLQVGRAVVLK